MILEFFAAYGLTIAALIAAFLLGAWLVWLKLSKPSDLKSGMGAEYVKGFNYLVNDQSDKAVEVFVKALEVDSETVELHLALGGLFRREGEVGRATRIHQNIIARPYLTEEQNRLAVYELARDYFKAGLFGRAENLFLELIDRKAYIESSLLSLLTIYESENEWYKAIDTAKKLPSSQLPDAASRIAHYWCEIAEIQISEGKFTEASTLLNQAGDHSDVSRRAMFLQGRMYLEKGNANRALEIWMGLLDKHDHLSDWVSDIICQDITIIGTDTQAVAFLHDLLLKHCSEVTAEKYLELNNYSQRSWDYVLECIGLKPSKTLVYWLLRNLQDSHKNNNLLPQSAVLSIVSRGLADSTNTYNARKCDVCGFTANTLHWQCPSCKRWDSQTRNL